MASILCKCGNRLSNSSVPNDVEYHIYSDFEWEEILRKDTWNVPDLPKPKHDAWKCPECKRIYVFSGDGKVVIVYKVEE